MIVRSYEQAKRHYESVKPLRGRSVDTRPLERRNRTQELIVKRGDAYALRLYNTDVITWQPDNSMTLFLDGWVSPTTAKFIHRFSPLSSTKGRKKVWVTHHERILYPVPNTTPLRMIEVDGKWQPDPASDYQPMRSQTDKAALKPLRDGVKPFMTWAKTFLALSDGQLHAQTIRECLPRNEYGLPYLSEALIKALGLSSQRHGVSFAIRQANYIPTLPEELYLPYLCALAVDRAPFFMYHIAHRPNDPIMVDYKALKESIYRQLRKHGVESVPYTPTGKFADRVL